MNKMMKKGLIVALIIAMLCPYVVSANEIEPFSGVDKTILFVSPTAKPGGDGTIDNPFDTIVKARDRIRELKKSGELGKDGACVYLREGRYEFNKTFILDKNDSGTKDAPIVYRGYKNEKAIITGSKKIPLKDFKKVTDQNILSKVIEESARDKIRVLDLKSTGFNGREPCYELAQRGDVVFPQPRFKSDVVLSVDGMLYGPARYPNGDETMVITEILHQGEDADYYGDDKKANPGYIPEDQRHPEDGFIIKSDNKRYLKWGEHERGVIQGFFGVGWSKSDCYFKIDKENETINCTHSLLYAELFKKPGWTFWAWHMLEELDVPGEYWTDGNGKLYCVLPDDADSSTDISLVVLTSGPVVKITGDYITLRNVTFGTGSKYHSAAEIAGGSHNEILNCVNEGKSRLAVTGGSYNGIKSCTTTAQLYISGGDSETLTKSNNYIENNHIYDFARAENICLMGGVGNRISNNDVHGSVDAGISIFGPAPDYGTQLNIVEYNDVWDVTQSVTDGGAIYAGNGTVTVYGNIFRYNYVHSFNNKMGNLDALGLCGIYLDDGTSGSLCVGNIIEDYPKGIHLSGSRDTILYNNIIVNAKIGVKFDDRSTWPSMVDPELGKIHTALRRLPYRSEPWKKAFPDLYNIYNNHPNDAMGTKYFNNLRINTQADSIASSFLDLYNEGNADFSSDPGFYDMKNGNYLLTPEGQEKVAGALPDFKQVPSTRIGRYNDRAYDRVKNATVLGLNTPNAIVNGTVTTIDEKDESIMPLLAGDTTYVPLRFIAESLGAEVGYDDETKTITINSKDRSLSMVMGSNSVVKDGATIQMEKPPVEYNNRTYVPLRAVSELLDYKVFWNDCGLIAIGKEDLFDQEADMDIITFLYNEITLY